MAEPKAPSKFQLREYTPADFETLWRLDQICFTHGIAYSKQELAHYIKQSRAFTLLAERDGAVCGFIVVESDGKGKGRIITIDVSPETRRAGLGGVLMSAAEEMLRTARALKIILEVAVDNLPAIAFYKRQGYSVVGTIRNYYLGSLDALRMEKTL